MGLIYWLFWGLALGLLDAMSTQPTGWVVNGMFSGLFLGLIFGLSGYGGEVIVQHYSLRWLLVRADILPYPFRDGCLIAYLDAMQDRILLRRVGGGWMFVHRSLLEHFTRMKDGNQ
jgi:eukaryotic-like serine/threonine-protein kinase